MAPIIEPEKKSMMKLMMRPIVYAVMKPIMYVNNDETNDQWNKV